MTVATIAQRLRDDHHVEVSESTVRRYIANTFTEARLEGKVTVPRGAVEPAAKPRSTTASSACGRPRHWPSGRGVGVRDDPVVSSALFSTGPADGPVSGTPRMWRRSSSSAVSRRGWSPKMFRGTFSVL